MERNTQIASVGQQLPQRMQQAQPVNLTQTGNDNTQRAYVKKYVQSVVILPGMPLLQFLQASIRMVR